MPVEGVSRNQRRDAHELWVLLGCSHLLFIELLLYVGEMVSRSRRFCKDKIYANTRGHLLARYKIKDSSVNWNSGQSSYSVSYSLFGEGLPPPVLKQHERPWRTISGSKEVD